MTALLFIQTAQAHAMMGMYPGAVTIPTFSKAALCMKAVDSDERNLHPDYNLSYHMTRAHGADETLTLSEQ